MILILSEKNDTSTSLVCLWLDKLGAKYKRYNTIYDIDITVSNLSDYNPMEYSVIWYRRSLKTNLDFSDLQSNVWKRGMNNELRSIKNTFYSDLGGFKIGSPFNSRINKVKQLNAAKEVGFNIPNYILTSSKEDLLSFCRKQEEIIVKPVSDVFSLLYDDYYVLPYTKKISKKEIETLPDKIYPSFFQEYIDKDYELRIFVFLDKIYAMAIFSQNDDKTAVDFRNYNLTKPSRRVRFKLSNDLEKKIFLFMKTMNLQTGSLDILVKDDKFYFLEVNPVGQFGMVSSPCSYCIEKDIALALLSFEK